MDYAVLPKGIGHHKRAFFKTSKKVYKRLFLSFNMAKKKGSKTEEKTLGKKLSKEEAEKEIVELAKKETPSAKIGLILKKEHGISRTKYEVGKVNQVLAKNKIKRFPEDLQNLIDKATKLRQHISKNAKDQVSRRGLLITEAKVRNLAKYFRKRGTIENTWEYKAQKAA